MKLMQRMKRVSIETLRNEFTEIDKTEQTYYIGKATYAFYEGEWHKRNDNGDSLGIDLLMYFDKKGNPKEMVMGAGTGAKLKNKEYMAVSTAKSIFETMAKDTNIEWGLTIQKDGTAKVYTDNMEDRINLRYTPGDVDQIIHSHVPGYELSDLDKQNAGTDNTIKWTLYYNGKYQNYDKYGLYGGYSY